MTKPDAAPLSCRAGLWAQPRRVIPVSYASRNMGTCSGPNSLIEERFLVSGAAHGCVEGEKEVSGRAGG